MARLRDLPVVVKHLGLLGFLKRVWQQIGEDQIFTWGAALAYSWMFAIFPFLIFLLSLLPLFPESAKTSIRENTESYLKSSLPQSAADTLMAPLKALTTNSAAQTASGLLSVGLVITIWAASGGMAMTMAGLDKAYDIEKGRPYIKQRLIAIALTIVAAILIILVMILLPVGTLVLTWLSHQGKIFGWVMILANVVRWALAVGLLITVLAMVYYFGPSFKQKFHAITPGAAFCVLVWIVLGVGFKLYVTRFGGAESYNKTYGAVAGAAILLLFFYIDALVLLIGAEINSELDFVVLGIPSGGSGELQQTVVTPTTMEPEQRALAEELRARRGDHAGGALATSSPALPAAAPPPPAGGAAATAGKLAAIAAVLYALARLIGSVRAKPRPEPKADPRPEPQRLRETYPVTYEVLKHDANGDSDAG
jgi:membrane protein